MKAAMLNYYQYVEDLLRPQDVHEQYAARERGASIGLSLISTLILLVVHAIFLYLIREGAVGAVPILAVHSVISVLLLIVSFALYRSGKDAPFMVLLAISTTFTGIFGAVGTLLCMVMYGFFRQQAISFQEWFSLIFPQDRMSASEETYNQITVGIDENPKSYEIMPFLDVMRLGNEAQKRRALSKITMNFHPRLAPALHMGLKDPSNAIRVQAATSVARIEASFMDKLAMIEEARKREPNNQHVLYALAQFYDDYAYTGLLEQERETLNREQAIRTYKQYLEQDPNHAGAWMAVGRLLYRGRHWREAADWFRNAIDRGWKQASMLIWYMECLFWLGDYHQLRDFAAEIGRAEENENLPENVRQAMALWAH